MSWSQEAQRMHKTSVLCYTGNLNTSYQPVFRQLDDVPHFG